MVFAVDGQFFCAASCQPKLGSRQRNVGKEIENRYYFLNAPGDTIVYFLKIL